MFDTQKKILRCLIWSAFFVTCLPTSLCAQSLELERDRALGMLDQVSAQIEKEFYDPALRGLHWKSLTQQARQQIKGAKTAGEMFSAIFSMVRKLNDSHTWFIPPSRVAKTEFGFEVKAFGDEVRIYEVKRGSAAERAGLAVGDRVQSINNYAVNRENVDLLMILLRSLRPVAEMGVVFSRGAEPPRTVRFDGKLKPGEQVIDMTNLNSIWDLIREAETEAADQRTKFRYAMDTDKVGSLRFPRIPGDKAFLFDFVRKVEKAEAILVDLRGNPGGSAEGLEYLIGMFERGQPDVAEVAGRRKTEPLRVKPLRPNLTVPLFILVDSQTGSAAEMFARHFQRTGRAVVIGDRTSGRVRLSRFYSRQMGVDTVVFYGVQVALARVLFPAGEDLEGKGITPDNTCIPTAEDMRAGRDPCLDLARSLAQKKVGSTP